MATMQNHGEGQSMLHPHDAKHQEESPTLKAEWVVLQNYDEAVCIGWSSMMALRSLVFLGRFKPCPDRALVIKPATIV